MNRIQKAIDVLLDAYNDNTLAKGNCKACAVGNLLAASQGLEVKQSGDNFTGSNTYWTKVFCTSIFQGNFRDFTKLDDELEAELTKTGFTVEELADIEQIFETNTEIMFDRYYELSIQEIKADQLKGLTAVINYLLTLDNIGNIEELFTSKLKVFA